MLGITHMRNDIPDDLDARLVVLSAEHSYSKDPGAGAKESGKPRRYHGTVILDPAHAGRDAGRITDEALTHLVGLVGSSVRATLEIQAEIPAGVLANAVPIGCFADPTCPPPQVAVYYRTRHPWFSLPKDLPTFQADASPAEIAAVLTKR
jgi:hypothetical protein